MKKVDYSTLALHSMDDQANIFCEAYKDQMDIYIENSIKTRVNESISPYEIVGVGKQLLQYENYQRFCESTSNLGALGAIPQIALDVIAASVGTSILPLVASIQPITEEHSIVYYKEMKAQQTSGGYNNQDVISSPLQRDNPGTGDLGGNRRSETLATTTSGTLAYAGNFDNVPLRPFRTNILVANVGTGIDDGNGNIIGTGFSGTVNYKTGSFSLTFTADPGTGKNIVATFDVDVDGAAALDSIQAGLKTKDIKAQIWALKSDVGAFANFAFQNRFGTSALDEVATDLTNELTRVLNTKAVKLLLAGKDPSATTTWTQNVSGVSYAENNVH